MLVTDDDILHVVSKWTGVPLSAHGAGRHGPPAQGGRANSRARSSARTKPSIAMGKALRRSRADLKDPKRPDRLVHFPRPDRRRQNPPRADARRIHVRRSRARSSRSTCPSTWTASTSRASSARLPATSVTRRAASSAKRCAAAPTPWCSSTKSRRPTPTSGPAPADPGGRHGHRLARPQDRFPQHDHHHDLERRRRADQARTWSWASASKTRRAQLRADEGQDPRGIQARLQARVPQPPRRPHRLPLADHATT